jgi:hypothetical protein
LSDKQERAIQARHLVEEGLFAERYAALQAQYIDEWKSAKTIEERERLHAKVAVMDEIRLDLVSIITTGEIDAENRS